MVKDGFHLYYEDTGGNAPALLFLHGAGGNHLSWWQQVPVFAEEYFERPDVFNREVGAFLKEYRP